MYMQENKSGISRTRFITLFAKMFGFSLPILIHKYLRLACAGPYPHDRRAWPTIINRFEANVIFSLHPGGNFKRFML